MAYILQVHPENPQPHRIDQAAQLLCKGAVGVIPTDSSYSLVCRMEDKEAVDRIRLIRQLNEKKHLTLLCQSLSQMSNLARVSNTGYRMAKSVTPGPYTFILEATREVPRRLCHPSKKTIGLRVPNNKVALALLEKIGEPLIGTTLSLPGYEEVLSEAWQIDEAIGNQLAFILDTGSSRIGDTTVIDLSGDDPVVLREGLGSLAPLGL